MIFPSHYLYFAIPQSSAQRSLFFSPDSFSLWSFIKFDQPSSVLYVNNSQMCVSVPDLCPMYQIVQLWPSLDKPACLHISALRTVFSPWASHSSERQLCPPRELHSRPFWSDLQFVSPRCPNPPYQLFSFLNHLSCHYSLYICET